ncbi:MAG: hypothetical protein GYB17_07440 [Gammaproteobacteria bacterium]|nr:hypothetical protein [Gammaproteobacteria bacterium]
MVKAELNNFALEKQLPRMADSGIGKKHHLGTIIFYKTLVWGKKLPFAAHLICFTTPRNKIKSAKKINHITKKRKVFTINLPTLRLSSATLGV